MNRSFYAVSILYIRPAAPSTILDEEGMIIGVRPGPVDFHMLTGTAMGYSADEAIGQVRSKKDEEIVKDFEEHLANYLEIKTDGFWYYVWQVVCVEMRRLKRRMQILIGLPR